MEFNYNAGSPTDKDLIEITKVAREVYCGGIYVPCDYHPCGWDFIDFYSIEEYEEILDYKFDYSDISNGIYDEHEYENKTLKEILKITEGQFDFEK